MDIISQNNAFNPNRMQDCCIAMLQKWLNDIPSPTWGKLDDAINLLRASLTDEVTDDCLHFGGRLY